ncbi:hypothetical protein PZ938_17145 [Luteipulveratus sp. YIM 133132]|uniref:hypothetical protein n=1 Tax=Luteipulveratus flavus TaxID=3031728 RepID=UPI0023B129C0|nr:hypothetical protein [Luteipulveratus sp. YIM 133132]MDE9367349.1 hypothetical protein [Luteipulveratus sp. YIM 133132]
MRYGEDHQRALVDAVFDELPEEMSAAADGGVIRPRDAGAMDALGQLRDDLEAALMLIKHPGFVDERETRYCVGIHHWLDEAALPPGVVRHRATAYGMAPYLVLTGTGEQGTPIVSTTAPLPIRALAISPSPNGRAATESARDLLAAYGYDVPVVRSRIPYRE